MRIKEILTRKNIVACSLFMLLGVIVTGFVWGQKSVKVIDGDKAATISTLATNPVKIISQAGFQLNDKDEYRLSTEKIQDNTVITIHRAIPVNVTYQGKTREIVTGKPTVGELLTELGISGDSIRAEPDQTTKITANVHIKAIAISEKVVEREIEEPYEIVRQPDPTMERGNQQIVSSGENGIKIAKVRLRFEDGVQVSEETIEETVTKPAAPEIIKVGARDTIDTSRGAMRFQRALHMEASAYLPSDGNGAGITATGIAARRGIVAVDPGVIPLGTRLYIPGYGPAVAADTGGAIRGNTIDLCMESYSEAMQFGRRTVKVYILD